MYCFTNKPTFAQTLLLFNPFLTTLSCPKSVRSILKAYDYKIVDPIQKNTTPH